VPKVVELRRHTANDGDVLTDEGISSALEVGRRLERRYDLLVSTGAQRATQSLACFLAGLGKPQDVGVIIDQRFRSEVEERWYRAYEVAGAGDLRSFQRADPELVEEESQRFAAALRDVFEALPDDGRALVVGHSPMHEAAVFGLTGEIVDPISKGAGVRITQTADGHLIESLD
jgi:broad specificity phosphatase PhoE